MKFRRAWTVVTILLSLSAVMYVGMHALFPARPDDIRFYTFLDIAFLPLSAVIVSLLIDGMLAARERAALLEKMNMVVGAFFSEVGRELIDLLLPFDSECERRRSHLLFTAAWEPRAFDEHRAAVVSDSCPMDLGAADVERLRDVLVRERSFFLQLLQNGNLLEHETFTGMLWALSHLAEELAARPDLKHLPPPDARHLELDMGRAYGRLLGEYLLYVKHLKAHYPYLFSFAMRTNPFDADAAVEVKE